VARLPDANALGGLPSASSGRQISSIDGSGIGQGMQNMASGMRALAAGQEAQGQGIARGAQAVARGIDEFAKEQERNALVKETLLDGERNIERMKLSERISTENNPDTIAELRGGFAKIDETFAAKIPDPQRRALAMNKWQQQTAGSVIDTNARHRTLYNDTVKASADNLIEEQRRKAVTSTDPKVRQQAIDEVNGQFDRLFQTGIIKNPEELKQRKRKFADDYSFDRFQMLTPQERYESSQPVNVGERSKAAYGFFQGRNWTPAQAAGIVGNLIHESVGLNTGARNPGDGRDGSDSVGLAQWNSTRAVALKAFAAQNKADWRDFNIQLAFVQNELETSEAPAAQRLRQAKTPREAAAAFAEYFLRPEGAGRGNPEGIHGFANRARQAEGVAAKFAGMKIEPTEGDRLYSMMPPERQLQVRESSARDYRQQIADMDREQKKAQQDWNATFDTRVENAGAAVMTTGRLPDLAPTEPEFIQRYGDREGRERAAKFNETVELGQNVQRLGQMSDVDAKAMIEAERPDVNDPLFETRQKSYELLQKAYTQDRAAREKDPAGYVQAKFPELAEAWKNADTNDSNEIATLMARTQSYQQQLGILPDKQRLLPGPIVSRAVEVFKNQDAPQPERLAAVKSLVFASSDDAQRRAVFKQLEAAGVPGMYRAVFEAEARGDEGAARRLAAAAMADPEKLKALDPKKASAAMIDDKIRNAILAPDSIGDAVYGFSAGRAENMEQAKDDRALLESYVRVQVAAGRDLDDAVTAGVKDIYGKVKVLSSNKALLAIPEGEDEGRINDALTMAMPKVREALDARIPPAPPAGAPAAAKEAHRLAKLQVERSNIDLLATGQWRSFGRDVAFVDKTTGLAVTLPGGKPLVMSLDDLKTGAARKPVDPAPTATVPDLSKTGADTTAADIAKRARDARRQQAPPAPVQSAERVPTFGGGASRLPE
jgi:hypothetical protein